MSSGKPIIKASSNTQKYRKERERLNISRNNLVFELKKNYTTNLKQLIFLIDKLKKYSDNVTINGEQFSLKLIFQIIEVLLERQNRLEYIDTHNTEKINRLSSEDLQILNTPIGFIMHNNTIEGGFEILNAMEDEMNTITNTDGITFTSTAKTNDERKNILNSWLDDLGRPNEKKKVTIKNNYYGGKKKKKRTKSLFKKKRTKRRRIKSLFKKKRTKRRRTKSLFKKKRTKRKSRRN